jgi:hypothetical protein
MTIKPTFEPMPNLSIINSCLDHLQPRELKLKALKVGVADLALLPLAL